MTAADWIAEQRRVEQAATEGPWVRAWSTPDQWWIIHGQPNPAKGDDRMVHKGDSMPDLIITEALVERCARAAYVAERPALGGDWEREGDAYKALYLDTARTVLTEALRPAPTTGPLDRQDPLIGES